MSEETLTYRLRKRAEIRRNIKHRKSVQEGKPDRIADLLEEAANELDRLQEAEQMAWDLQSHDRGECFSQTIKGREAYHKFRNLLDRLRFKT